MFKAVFKTKQRNKVITDTSPEFDNQLQAEMWLGSCCRQAKELKVKIVDHYLIKTQSPLTKEGKNESYND